MSTITSMSACGCFSWHVLTISKRPSTICDAVCSWLLVPASTTITCNQPASAVLPLYNNITFNYWTQRVLHTKYMQLSIYFHRQIEDTEETRSNWQWTWNSSWTVKQMVSVYQITRSDIWHVSNSSYQHEFQLQANNNIQLKITTQKVCITVLCML